MAKLNRPENAQDQMKIKTQGISTAFLLLVLVGYPAAINAEGNPLPFEPSPQGLAESMSNGTFKGKRWIFSNLSDCDFGQIGGDRGRPFLANGHINYTVIPGTSKTNPYYYECKNGYVTGEPSPMGTQVCEARRIYQSARRWYEEKAKWIPAKGGFQLGKCRWRD